MKPLLTALSLLILVAIPGYAEEVVEWDDLVEREYLWYKKFTDVPFSGKVTGEILYPHGERRQLQGSFKNGGKIYD